MAAADNISDTRKITISWELNIKEAHYLMDALNLAADLIDNNLPDADMTIGFDNISEDVKKQVRACLILGGYANMIKDQLQKDK